MNRRDVIHGLSGLATFSSVQPASTRQPSTDDEAVARAVEGLRDAVQNALQASPELSRIREQQRTFLRANQKFPDFLDVGIGVWESVHDWHVRHQYPLTVSRLGDGRYAMSVLFTTLILRPDQSEAYIGFGYDVR